MVVKLSYEENLVVFVKLTPHNAQQTQRKAHNINKNKFQKRDRKNMTYTNI